MTLTSAITVDGDSGNSGKDMPIFLRVSGHEKTYWYVIEEKSSMNSLLSSGKEVIECESEKDRVRRISLPQAGMTTNNLVVLNSHVYLIGGDLKTNPHSDDDSLPYLHMDLNLDLGAEEWRVGGGKLADHQYEGGVAVDHDNCLYSVGRRVYRLSPGADRWEMLPKSPKGLNPELAILHRLRLLGITKTKLYVYIVEGGFDKANVMLSFDLNSSEWDDDVLDDNFWGVWSPGVVLYEDRYLFSFGTRSPKLNPRPQEPKSMKKRVQVNMLEEEEEMEVPGIYAFDLNQRQWLHEPVQGLPSDGTMIPYAYQPSSDSDQSQRFSPHLFQIRKDDDRYLALLWDFVGKFCQLTWSKFKLEMSTTTSNDIPRFSAHSLSLGFCPLDKNTSFLLNSAVGI